MHWQSIKNKVNQCQKGNGVGVDRIIDGIYNMSSVKNSNGGGDQNSDNIRMSGGGGSEQKDNNGGDDDRLFISERSIYSDKYLLCMIDRFIFAKNSYECNFMNDAEMQIYDHWFNYLTE